MLKGDGAILGEQSNSIKSPLGPKTTLVLDWVYSGGMDNHV